MTVVVDLPQGLHAIHASITMKASGSPHGRVRPASRAAFRGINPRVLLVFLRRPRVILAVLPPSCRDKPRNYTAELHLKGFQTECREDFGQGLAAGRDNKLPT